MKHLFLTAFAVLFFCVPNLKAACPDASWTAETFVAELSAPTPACSLFVEYCWKVNLLTGELEVIVGRATVESDDGAPCRSKTIEQIMNENMPAIIIHANDKAGITIMPCPQKRTTKISFRGCRTPDITFWRFDNPEKLTKILVSFRCNSDYRCWEIWEHCYESVAGVAIKKVERVGFGSDGTPCTNTTFTYNPASPDLEPTNESQATVSCIPMPCP